MTIGEALKKIRTEKGISAKTLSKNLGLYKSYIAKVENNEIVPTNEKLKQIYKNLEIPDELISILLLDKSNFSEAKKEIYQAINPVLIELFVDYAINIIKGTNLPVEQNDPDLALIMKGGGIKGIAYMGALEELTKHYKFN